MATEAEATRQLRAENAALRRELERLSQLHQQEQHQPQQRPPTASRASSPPRTSSSPPRASCSPPRASCSPLRTTSPRRAASPPPPPPLTSGGAAGRPVIPPLKPLVASRASLDGVAPIEDEMERLRLGGPSHGTASSVSSPSRNPHLTRRAGSPYMDLAVTPRSSGVGSRSPSPRAASPRLPPPTLGGGRSGARGRSLSAPRTQSPPTPREKKESRQLRGDLRGMVGTMRAMARRVEHARRVVAGVMAELETAAADARTRLADNPRLVQRANTNPMDETKPELASGKLQVEVAWQAGSPSRVIVEALWKLATSSEVGYQLLAHHEETVRSHVELLEAACDDLSGEPHHMATTWLIYSPYTRTHAIIHRSHPAAPSQPRSFYPLSPPPSPRSLPAPIPYD